jgi:hypothetical protein
MEYQIQNTLSGSWAKGSELSGIVKAKIVSETKPEPSQFRDKKGNIKNQDVCKIRFEGKPEVFNISLNRATINGLIKAFGKNSLEWMNKELKVETEKVRVAGVARTAIYLIADGFEKVDNDEGFAEIRKIGGEEKNISQPEDYEGAIPTIEEGEIDVKTIPF